MSQESVIRRLNEADKGPSLRHNPGFTNDAKRRKKRKEELRTVRPATLVEKDKERAPPIWDCAVFTNTECDSRDYGNGMDYGRPLIPHSGFFLRTQEKPKRR